MCTLVLCCNVTVLELQEDKKAQEKTAKAMDSSAIITRKP